MAKKLRQYITPLFEFLDTELGGEDVVDAIGEAQGDIEEIKTERLEASPDKWQGIYPELSEADKKSIFRHMCVDLGLMETLDELNTCFREVAGQYIDFEIKQAEEEEGGEEGDDVPEEQIEDEAPAEEVIEEGRRNAPVKTKSRARKK